MNNYSEQIDEIMAKNGLDEKSVVGAKSLALVVAILSSTTLAPRVLPDSFMIVKTSDDVDAAISRVVSDEGFALATLRSVALYLRAAFDNELDNLDVGAVQGFYDAYQVASEEDRRVALVGTLRLMHDLMQDEVARIGGEDAERLLAATEGSFDAFVQETANEPSGVMLFNLENNFTFAINLAQTIIKMHEGDKGLSVDGARDANRLLGAFSGMMLNQLADNLAGIVVQEIFKQAMPEEDYETVNAILELQYGTDEDGTQPTIQ